MKASEIIKQLEEMVNLGIDVPVVFEEPETEYDEERFVEVGYIDVLTNPWRIRFSEFSPAQLEQNQIEANERREQALAEQRAERAKREAELIAQDDF